VFIYFFLINLFHDHELYHYSQSMICMHVLTKFYEYMILLKNLHLFDVLMNCSGESEFESLLKICFTRIYLHNDRTSDYRGLHSPDNWMVKTNNIFFLVIGYLFKICFKQIRIVQEKASLKFVLLGFTYITVKPLIIKGSILLIIG
jgi:hypothetical protein